MKAFILFIVFILNSPALAENHKGATYPLKTFPPDCSLYIDPKEADKYSHCEGPIKLKPRKWEGYLEFMGKPGTARNLGQTDLFVPLMQDENDMSFINLRGQVDFDNSASEYNIGFGHRHIFSKAIVGGYVYFDQRKSDIGNMYEQVTIGMEVLSENFDIRMNGYIPEDKTKIGDPQLVIKGNQIKVNFDYETALHGLDGEIGVKVPFNFLDDTRLYFGGYHFIGKDGYDSVSGPRVRLEMRLHDLPFLGAGSRLMLGLEAQYDEPRGQQSFGLVSIRIPFGVGSKKTRNPLKGLDRRMMEPVVRDSDIVTGNKSVKEAALDPAWNEYTEYREFKDKDDMDAQTEKAVEEDNWFGNMGGSATKVIDWDLIKFTTPGTGTFAIADKLAPIGYIHPFTGVRGIINFVPGGVTPVFNFKNRGPGLFNMAAGDHINGWDLNAAGEEFGLRFFKDEKYYITNTSIYNADDANVAIVDATVFVNNLELYNSKKGVIIAKTGKLQGIDVTDGNIGNFFGKEPGGSMVIFMVDVIQDKDNQGLNGLTIDATNYSHGLFIDQPGNYFVTNSTLQNSNGNLVWVNCAYGWCVAGKEATLTIASSIMRNSKGRGEHGSGVKAKGTGAVIHIKDSLVANNGGHGLNAYGGTIFATNVDVIGNKESGYDANGVSSYIEIIGGLISGNLDGLMANIGNHKNVKDTFNKIIARNVTIENNGVGARNYGGILEIYDSRIINNRNVGVYSEALNGYVVPHTNPNGDHGGNQGDQTTNIYGDTIYFGYQDCCATTTIVNSTITGNKNLGIYNRGGQITVINSIVSDNPGGNYLHLTGISPNTHYPEVEYCLRSDSSFTVDGVDVPGTFPINNNPNAANCEILNATERDYPGKR